MGQIYSTVLTSQWSPHHSCCVCPGDQQHPCAWFQELQAWDMVHVPLQAPVVLLYKATSFLAQNKGKTPSLVSCGSKPAEHAGCLLSTEGQQGQVSQPAFILTTQPPSAVVPPPGAGAVRREHTLIPRRGCRQSIPSYPHLCRQPLG